MGKPTKKSITKVQLALYGATGAIVPDILILYSKRWTATGLTFSISQYVLATALYVGLAALVAMIIPYRGKPTAWKAFSAGIALPVILAGVVSLNNDPAVVPRGTTLPGTLQDLLSLF